MTLKKYLDYLPSKDLLILIFIFSYNPHQDIDTSTRLGRIKLNISNELKKRTLPTSYISVFTQIPRFVSNYDDLIVRLESKYFFFYRQPWKSNFLPEHWVGLTLVGSLGIDFLILLRNRYTFKHQNRAFRRNKRYRIPRLFERYYMCMLYSYVALSLSTTFSHCAEALYFTTYPRLFIVLQALLETFQEVGIIKSAFSQFFILTFLYTNLIRAHEQRTYFIRYHAGQVMSLDIMHYTLRSIYIFWIDFARLPPTSLKRLTVGFYIYIFLMGLIAISIFHALIGTIPRIPFLHKNVIGHAGYNSDNDYFKN